MKAPYITTYPKNTVIYNNTWNRVLFLYC